MKIDALTDIFVIIDDFCIEFIPKWEKLLIKSGGKINCRKRKLSISEAMTIVIAFHSSGYRTFKDFYFYLKNSFQEAFPNLPSYSRFVEIMQGITFPLFYFIQIFKGDKTGIYFVDSTVIKICHNKRIKRNKVFKKLAKIGKSTMGWFYGFKLHLIINDKGEIIAFNLTPGNTDDRKALENMHQSLVGKIFGDKGYISQKLFEKLFQNGLQLITTLKKNMKQKLLPIMDKILLRKRSLIETVNDQLKNIAQIEHTRHRSPKNFLVNILAGICSYILQPKKPSLNLSKDITDTPILLGA